MKRFFLFTACLFLTAAAASAREVYDLSRGWKFYTCDERDSVRVSLPHTWNDADALAGRTDYYRGVGNYMKNIRVQPSWRGKRIFVRFYGAGTVADLMVNGRHVGEHSGGNNAFEFEITDYLNYDGRNLLWVIVNNAPRLDVLPTAGQDNVYGGLFRGAEIIVTEPVAVGFDGYGGSGVRFGVGAADSERASGEAAVSVNSPENRNVLLSMRIFDGRDSLVYARCVKHRAVSGVSVAEIPYAIDAPHLWNGTADPYLYTVAVTLADGNRIDSVSFRTGFRSFRADAREGFFLNGESYPLRGVVLWRDQAVYGPVFNEEQLRRDVGLIKEMGANAVRVAGGTHHPAFYDICDEEGIIVLADGPFTGSTALDARGYYNTEGFRSNAERQLRELICQHYNNPSVMFWGIFSEPEMIGDDPVPFIKRLNAVAKELDPSRLTVGISNKDGEVNRITDLMVWNHTFGWKTGLPSDISIWRDQLHGDPVWNTLRSAVSYRAEGAAGQYAERLRRDELPKRHHPENRQAYVHEVHLGAVQADNGFWGIFVGDMFDHGSVRLTSDGRRGVDGCGLVSFDRSVKKDAFWLYKANWNMEEPFLHIASRRHPQRRYEQQEIIVYSNMPAAELYVNGISCGTRNAENGVMKWDGVRLEPGSNRVSVRGSVDDAGSGVVKDDIELSYSPQGLL